MKRRTVVNMHQLCAVPPSCCNRDKDGLPKTARVGGTTRLRWSSQSVKRPIRLSLADHLEGMTSIRTTALPYLICEEMVKLGVEESEAQMVRNAVQSIYCKTSAGSDQAKTSQLVMFGSNYPAACANAIIKLRSDKPDTYKQFCDPVMVYNNHVYSGLIARSMNDKVAQKVADIAWHVSQCPPDYMDLDPTNDNPTLDDADNYVSHIFDLDDSQVKEVIKSGNKMVKQSKDNGNSGKNKAGDVGKFIEHLLSLDTERTVDMALYGRMTTANSKAHVDGSVMQAHAISVDAIDIESDYATAVDDVVTNTGAAHIREDAFASACMYMYSSLGWDACIDNLTDKNATPTEAEKRLAARLLGIWIISSAMSRPTGKQHSYAAHTDPHGILIEVCRNGYNLSYANAYIEPVVRVGKYLGEGLDEMTIEGRSVLSLAARAADAHRALHGICEQTSYWYSPSLHRFPLHYYEHDDNGNKSQQFKLVTENRYGNLMDFVRAVVKDVTGYEWDALMETGS